MMKKIKKVFDKFTLYYKKCTNFASLSIYRCGVKKLRNCIYQSVVGIVDYCQGPEKLLFQVLSNDSFEAEHA